MRQRCVPRESHRNRLLGTKRETFVDTTFVLAHRRKRMPVRTYKAIPEVIAMADDDSDRPSPRIRRVILSTVRIRRRTLKGRFTLCMFRVSCFHVFV